MEKKYELTETTMEISKGKVLHRIKALKSFGYVKKGNIGGWVESEANLSQEGDCWIYDCAAVIGNAEIRDSAVVKGVSFIGDNAVAKDHALVIDSVMLDNSVVKDNATINSVKMSGNSCVMENALLNASIRKQLIFMKGNSCIGGNANISGGIFTGNVKILQSYITDFGFGVGYDLDGNMEVRYPDEIMAITVAGLDRILARNSEGGIICYRCPASTGDKVLEVVKKKYEANSEDYIKYTTAINLLKETIKFNDMKESMK